MIVLNRNGERTVITGWREWLIWFALAVALVVIGCLALGFALTLLTVALFALPVAVLLIVLAGLFSRPR